jgi:pilus assembly protein Flp/PilA
VTSLYVRVRVWFASLRQADDGATAVEYALMLALIFMVVIVAVAYLGRSTNNVYSNVGASFPP